MFPHIKLLSLFSGREVRIFESGNLKKKKQPEKNKNVKVACIYYLSEALPSGSFLAQTFGPMQARPRLTKVPIQFVHTFFFWGGLFNLRITLPPPPQKK